MYLNPHSPLKSTDLRTADLQSILTLNNLHAKQTSLLSYDSLAQLLANACYAQGVDGGASALLIALDESAAYDNPNFRWFRERYKRFVYIDRIIVSDSMRGRGVARSLYADLFAWALSVGQQHVVCEVNSEPPNPESDKFHATMGFVVVGEAEIYGGAKTVRYLHKLVG